MTDATKIEQIFALEKRQQELLDEKTQLTALIEKMHRCFLPAIMFVANQELTNGPMADDAVVFEFNGPGASDRVTLKQFKEATGYRSLTQL
jgi:hypothetical protein